MVIDIFNPYGVMYKHKNRSYISLMPMALLKGVSAKRINAGLFDLMNLQRSFRMTGLLNDNMWG